MKPVTRRNLMRFVTGLPFIGMALPAFARTPSATEGPFYPTEPMRFSDIDNNLVRIAGAVKAAGGEVIILKGRILDADKTPIKGARIEIWQCDANGVYLHTRDRRRAPYDTAFQGFGHVVTGDDGAYAFRTIKPVTYPGRTPHIHVKVFHNRTELTTQFYLEDHPQNARDRLYRRLSKADRNAVTMRFAPGKDGPEAVVDVTL